MPRLKEHERDNAVGMRLTQWMSDNRHDDGTVAKETGATAASVRLWRLGTRPSAKFRTPLEELTGWAWDAVNVGGVAKTSDTGEVATQTSDTEASDMGETAKTSDTGEVATDMEKEETAEASNEEAATPKARETQSPMPKRPPKDEARDKRAGDYLAYWMAQNSYTDRRLMDAVGKPKTETTATVATWRKGTRPSAKWLVKLEAVVGWSWDSPPPLPVDYSALNMFLAEQTLSDMLQRNTPIDLNDPSVRSALDYALENVRGQIAAHDVQSSVQDCRDLIEFVMGHSNPTLALMMITNRWGIVNLDSNMVEKVLAQWRSRNGVHAQTVQ